MNRRTILRGTLALGTLGMAGCLGDTGGSTEGTTSSTTGTTETTTTEATTTREAPDRSSETRYEKTSPPPDPSRPDPLTPEAAVEYVQALELRRSYERIAMDGMTKLRLHCKTFLHRGTPEGYVVVSGCGGSSTDGGTHADRGGVPAFYHVTPDRTTRIERTQRAQIPEEDAYRGPSGENLDHPTGFRIYNFRDEETRFRVRVVHRESGEEAYGAGHGLASESGVEVDDVVARRGTYDFRVTVEGTEFAGSWSVTGQPDGGSNPLAVTFVPGPDLGIERSKVGEILGIGPV